MTRIIKEALEEINKVSRHLLSCLLTVKKSLQENTSIVDSSKPAALNNTANNKEVSQEYIEQLISERDTLIRALFTQYDKEALSVEAILLNQMVSLDSDITTHSSVCKKALSEQVIKLKKGKKVSKKYQQY